jgi:hypothetical protein
LWSCFFVELIFAFNNLFHPTGSTLQFSLSQRTFGTFNKEAFWRRYESTALSFQIAGDVSRSITKDPDKFR